MTYGVTIFGYGLVMEQTKYAIWQVAIVDAASIREAREFAISAAIHKLHFEFGDQREAILEAVHVVEFHNVRDALKTSGFLLYEYADRGEIAKLREMVKRAASA